MPVPNKQRECKYSLEQFELTHLCFRTNHIAASLVSFYKHYLGFHLPTEQQVPV